MRRYWISSALALTGGLLMAAGADAFHNPLQRAGGFGRAPFSRGFRDHNTLQSHPSGVIFVHPHNNTLQPHPPGVIFVHPHHFEQHDFGFHDQPPLHRRHHPGPVILIPLRNPCD